MSNARGPAAIVLLGSLILLTAPLPGGYAPAEAAVTIIDDLVCSAAVSGGDFVSFHSPIGEIIRPRLGTITSVLVYVEFSSVSGPAPLTLRIHRGSISGPVIAEKTKQIDIGGPRWEEFSFSEPVEVDPGEPYFLELFSTYAVSWKTMGYDCPNGDKVRDGALTTGNFVKDYLFKTRGIKPSLGIGLNQTEVTLTQGSSKQVQVLLTSVHRFEGEVSLRTTDLSASGITTGFDDPTPFVPAGGRKKITLSILASEDATPGDYTLRVTATFNAFWGGLAVQEELTLHVVEAPRDFALSISPTERTVEAGSEAMFTVEVTPVGDFDQAVHLSVSGLPEDTTYSFTRPSGVPPFSTTLTVSIQTSTPEGSSAITVSGSAGSLSHSVTAQLTVQRSVQPDFSISLSPASLTVTQGDVAEFEIEIIPIGGFSDPVTVSLEGLPQDSTFSVTQTGAYTATLSIQTGEAVGSFVLTVTASGGGKTHSAMVTLVVNPRATQPPQTTAPPTSSSPPSTTSAPSQFDFEVEVSPSAAEARTGDTVTFTVALRTLSGAPQPVSLRVSGLPSDYAYSIAPEQVTPDGISTLEVRTGATTGTFSVTVTASGGGSVKTATATLTVQPAQAAPSRCVIATAAYGSELAPQVQMLREFRDEDVAATFAGSAFLRVFNAFYYSWSPGVAEFISGRPSLMAAVRLGITPLLWSLSASKMLMEVMGPSETSVTIAGVVASGLLGVMYLLAPLVLALRLLAGEINPRWVRAALAADGAGLLILALGVASSSHALAALGSTALVLSTLVSVPLGLVWAFTKIVALRRF